MNLTEEHAKLAFETYTENKPSTWTAPVPTWDELGSETKSAWVAAMQTVFELTCTKEFLAKKTAAKALEFMVGKFSITDATLLRATSHAHDVLQSLGEEIKQVRLAITTDATRNRINIEVER